MFSGLLSCDGRFSAWYEIVRSVKRARDRPANVESTTYLVDLMNRGRSRNDDANRSIIVDLGFLACLWNGRDPPDRADIRFSCGCHLYLLGNNVILDLPAALGELATSDACRLSLSRSSGPGSQNGVVPCQPPQKATDFRLQVPFVDWMFYFCKEVALEIPPLLPPACVQKIDAFWLPRYCPRRTAGHCQPDHQRNIRQVEEALGPLLPPSQRRT